MAKFVKHTACGFLMQKELDHLALDACERPLAAIVGGAKVSTKLPVIQSLMAKWCVGWVGSMKCNHRRRRTPPTHPVSVLSIQP